LFNGKFFTFPTTSEELAKCWEEANPLTDDMIPHWIKNNGNNPDDYRYLGNTTWAYLHHSEQDDYWNELNQVFDGEFPGILADEDEGDGCVTHLYVCRS